MEVVEGDRVVDCQSLVVLGGDDQDRQNPEEASHGVAYYPDHDVGHRDRLNLLVVCREVVEEVVHDGKEEAVDICKMAEDDDAVSSTEEKVRYGLPYHPLVVRKYDFSLCGTAN